MEVFSYHFQVIFNTPYVSINYFDQAVGPVLATAVFFFLVKLELYVSEPMANFSYLGFRVHIGITNYLLHITGLLE